MKIINGALVREQNENDVDDSCFDTSELRHMTNLIVQKSPFSSSIDQIYQVWSQLSISQFIIDGKLQRHPQTNFMNDISSDQAHMFSLATGMRPSDIRTSNGDIVSLGFLAFILNMKWLSNLCLLGQIILFWVPLRWCDGNNPTVRFGPIKLNIGYRHHCGDYRLFKQCLYYSPWIIRRLVSKKTLKKMTRYYWEPEPNSGWLIAIDDRFIDEAL